MEDIEIARNVLKKDIKEIASNIGIMDDNLILYGNDKAKIDIVSGNVNGQLVLVTAITPTPFGEGKTTVSIGLADALNRIGKKTILTLREPSMGPVFGIKGGATGGGYSQVVPMDDINLHFTGDFPAIEAANNLLCAAIDNHIAKGNDLNFNKITFNRCLDVNDRSLRSVTTKMSRTGFDITAASEIMALFCLASDINDLKKRIGNIIVGYTIDNNEIYAKDLHIEGAMTVILKDAFKPNLVQTLEYTPTLIHGGPFANIAHGCNSIVATKIALEHADIVVTEAGFGSDLGAEKFFDIKCRYANIKPDCVVIVATIKALKYNAGVSKNDILISDTDKVKSGLSNLKVHIENMLKFNTNVVVCLNKYATDSDDEIDVVRNFCHSIDISFDISTSYVDGGKGAITLAQNILEELNKENEFNYIYDINDSIFTKIDKISKYIYRSSEVIYGDLVKEKINLLQQKGYGNLPICIAKTQYSISDDSKLLGAPLDNILHINDVKVYNGAGFITVFTGNIMTMPGLPKDPNYEKIDYINGKIIGLS